MNTKLLPADPDELNDDRAEWAGEAIDAFAAAVYAERNTEDDTTILADLLANLRHWADRNAVDFDTAMVRALCHYADETMPEVPMPVGFILPEPDVALTQLRDALSVASTSGLLDMLAVDLHPDTINQFCDAVKDMDIDRDMAPAQDEPHPVANIIAAHIKRCSEGS
jgi:hypothetical protein